MSTVPRRRRTRTAASGRICSLFLLFPEEILRQRAAVAECERRGAAHAQAAGCALGVVSRDMVYIDSIAEMPCEGAATVRCTGHETEGRQNALLSRYLRGICPSVFLSFSLSHLFLSTEKLQVFVYIGTGERASTCVELASALLARDWNAHERTARKKRTPDDG